MQKTYLKSVDLSELSQTEGISEYDAFTLWTYLKKMPQINTWWPLYDLPGFGEEKVEVLDDLYDLVTSPASTSASVQTIEETAITSATVVTTRVVAAMSALPVRTVIIK